MKCDFCVGNVNFYGCVKLNVREVVVKFFDCVVMSIWFVINCIIDEYMCFVLDFIEF